MTSEGRAEVRVEGRPVLTAGRRQLAVQKAPPIQALAEDLREGRAQLAGSRRQLQGSEHTHTTHTPADQSKQQDGCS